MTKGEEACVSLETHFNSRIEAVDQRITSIESSAKEAIALATKAQDKRLDLLNEFRQQSETEGRKYFLTSTHEEYRKSVAGKLEELDRQISRLYGGIITVGAIGVANLVKLWMRQ
jgi:phage-related tail protein